MLCFYTKSFFLFFSTNLGSNYLTLSDCFPDKPKPSTSNETTSSCGSDNEAVAICAGRYMLFCLRCGDTKGK